MTLRCICVTMAMSFTRGLSYAPSMLEPRIIAILAQSQRNSFYYPCRQAS